jgi:hypothetical protein
MHTETYINIYNSKPNRNPNPFVLKFSPKKGVFMSRIDPEITSALLNSTKSSVPSYLLKATLEFALRNQRDKHPMPSAHLIKNLLDSLMKNSTNLISKGSKNSAALEYSEKKEKIGKNGKGKTVFYKVYIR